MNTDEGRFNHITEKVIGCAFKVGAKLSFGFAEKCYHNAMLYELAKAGLKARSTVPLQVWYEEIVVGEYDADIIVEDVVILELKAMKGLDGSHHALCINYLTATRLPLCLLINFGLRVEVKRIAGPTLKRPD